MEAGLHPNTTHCSWVTPSRACVRRQDCDWYLTTVTRCKGFSHLPFVNYQCCFPSCCCELSDLEKNPDKFLFFGASPWETSYNLYELYVFIPLLVVFNVTLGRCFRRAGVIVWVLQLWLPYKCRVSSFKRVTLGQRSKGIVFVFIEWRFFFFSIPGCRFS